MAQPRRMAVDGARQRELIVDAAEALLADGAGTTISARTVTGKAGLKSQLLYYYFHTMDELILEVVRRIEARRIRRLETALAEPDPLLAIWEMNTDPAVTTLSSGILALAGRSRPVRDEIIRAAREFRAMQVKAVTQLLNERGASVDPALVAGMIFIASAVMRTIDGEAAFGLSDGHEQAREIIEKVIRCTGGAD
ncbi:MAG TPA: TetR/AcrR family transcriptional regulator [Novosphingobium sp.]